MVRRALLPGALATLAAAAIGALAGGVDDAASAAIGIAVVIANFALHGLSLSWAAGISISAVQAVALGGVVLRMGVVVASLFALRTLPWFSVVAFALAAVPGTMLLLGYEAHLMLRGVGTSLDLPPDPAAARAAERLAAKESR